MKIQREAVEQRVVELVRECAMNQSTREVDLDDPLGDAGLGLDSLALVQFLTALEGAYKVQIPLEFWSRADEASLRQCADEIMATRRPG
jgi:acyl carrier protein